MSESGVLLSRATNEHETRGDVYVYWCPGCAEHHQIVVGPGMWGFDGDQYSPTVEGSVLVRGPQRSSEPKNYDGICHSFIRAGRIEYLSDCTHELANQTVPMRPFES